MPKSKSWRLGTGALFAGRLRSRHSVLDHVSLSSHHRVDVPFNATSAANPTFYTLLTMDASETRPIPSGFIRPWKTLATYRRPYCQTSLGWSLPVLLKPLSSPRCFQAILLTLTRSGICSYRRINLRDGQVRRQKLHSPLALQRSPSGSRLRRYSESTGIFQESSLRHSDPRRGGLSSLAFSHVSSACWLWLCPAKLAHHSCATTVICAWGRVWRDERQGVQWILAVSTVGAYVDSHPHSLPSGATQRK